MTNDFYARSPEIDCQLDEILTCLSCGIPEEYVMRRIGVSYDDWVRYKVDRFHTLSPLSPTTVAAARKPLSFMERRTFKPPISHIRKLILAP